jgi:hypothetical protein
MAITLLQYRNNAFLAMKQALQNNPLATLIILRDLVSYRAGGAVQAEAMDILIRQLWPFGGYNAHLAKHWLSDSGVDFSDLYEPPDSEEPIV